jgi:hypothetical protein
LHYIPTIILGFLFLYSCGHEDTTWISILLILINAAVIMGLLASCLHRMREYLREITNYLPEWLVNSQEDNVTMTVNKRASRNTTKSANVNDMELSSI